MEELAMDTNGIASNLADALVYYYWRAQVDANNVGDAEFLMSSEPEA